MLQPSRDIMEFVSSLGWDTPLRMLIAKYGERLENPPPASVPSTTAHDVELAKMREELFLNETADETARRCAQEVQEILKKTAQLDDREKKKEVAATATNSTWTKVGRKK